jgi:hypothetical protein
MLPASPPRAVGRSLPCPEVYLLHLVLPGVLQIYPRFSNFQILDAVRGPEIVPDSPVAEISRAGRR